MALIGLAYLRLDWKFRLGSVLDRKAGSLSLRLGHPGSFFLCKGLRNEREAVLALGQDGGSDLESTNYLKRKWKRRSKG